MPVKQGALELLQHPASQELLRSKIPARLAYVWMDGTPRVVPIWFHWNEKDGNFVLATPTKAPKLKALAKNPKVALTIDDNTFPNKVLLVRGSVPGPSGAYILIRRAKNAKKVSPAAKRAPAAK